MCNTHRHLGGTRGQSLGAPKADITELSDSPAAGQKLEKRRANIAMLPAPHKTTVTSFIPDPAYVKSLVAKTLNWPSVTREPKK